MSTTYYTLIFIKTTNQILLGYKKRGLGEGTWNGYGGKLKKNETMFDGAVRELHEESNLTVNQADLNYLGVVTCIDTCNELHTRIVHIFTASKISGELKETEEMRPQWFDFGNLPYEQMWPDYESWLPLVLKDCWLDAKFTYKGNNEIEEYEVRELEIPPASYFSIDNDNYETTNTRLNTMHLG